MTTTSGVRGLHDVQGVGAVAGGADDLHAVEDAEQGDETVADDLVVVDDDDAGWAGGLAHDALSSVEVRSGQPGADGGAPRTVGR